MALLRRLIEQFPDISEDVVRLVFQQRGGDLSLVTRDLNTIEQERQKHDRISQTQQVPNQTDNATSSSQQASRASRTSGDSDTPNISPSNPININNISPKNPQPSTLLHPNVTRHRSESEISDSPHPNPVQRTTPQSRIIQSCNIQKEGQKWIATVNVSGSPTKVGEFDSHQQALEMGDLLSPPVWQEGNTCCCCAKELGILSGRHHCRNCGFVVCGSCSRTRWPTAMVPPLYCIRPDNKKQEKRSVRVCDSCHELTELFRLALLSGDLDAALDLESTGNINLNRPFAIYPNHLFPVHSAALGGNAKLLRWLVEDKHCPLLVAEGDQPLCTRDGKSALALACERRHANIVFLCVREFGCSVTEVRDVAVLQGILNVFVNLISPEDVLSRQTAPVSPHGLITESYGGHSEAPPTQATSSQATSSQAPPSQVPPINTPLSHRPDQGHSGSVGGIPIDASSPKAEDEIDDDMCCIVCFERPIDCVLVPCGHSCVCVACSSVLNHDCPVCRNEFRQAVKIYHVSTSPSFCCWAFCFMYHRIA
eukprot:c9286_g1_i2.p1 GENE.c9286_g1_i2~~c9286_g1_i2.p1  ORF type:complete len:538 (-),score=62.36 c9286_g1_i2:208-1821(-)